MIRTRTYRATLAVLVVVASSCSSFNQSTPSETPTTSLTDLALQTGGASDTAEGDPVVTTSTLVPTSDEASLKRIISEVDAALDASDGSLCSLYDALVAMDSASTPNTKQEVKLVLELIDRFYNAAATHLDKSGKDGQPLRAFVAELTKHLESVDFNPNKIDEVRFSAPNVNQAVAEFGELLNSSCQPEAPPASDQTIAPDATDQVTTSTEG